MGAGFKTKKLTPLITTILISLCLICKHLHSISVNLTVLEVRHVFPLSPRASFSMDFAAVFNMFCVWNKTRRRPDQYSKAPG